MMPITGLSHLEPQMTWDFFAVESYKQISLITKAHKTLINR